MGSAAAIREVAVLPATGEKLLTTLVEKLGKLYGDTLMAKEAHLEAIAASCLENPTSADSYFVLGIFLHYTGEADRAEKFFAKAAELGGPDTKYLARFVPGIVAVKADGLEL